MKAAINPYWDMPALIATSWVVCSAADAGVSCVTVGNVLPVAYWPGLYVRAVKSL